MFRKYLLTTGLLISSMGSFSQDLFPVKVNYQWGLINEDGEVVKEPFADHLSNAESGFYRFRKGDKVGVLESDLNIAIEPVYSRIRILDSNRLLCYDGASWSLMDPKAKSIARFTAQSVDRLTDNIIMVYGNDSRFVLEVGTGRRLSDFDRLQEAGHFVKVYLDEDVGLFTSELIELFPVNFSDIELYASCIGLRQEDHWAVADYSGHIVTGYDYKSITEQSGELALAILEMESGEKHALVPWSGKLIRPAYPVSAYTALDSQYVVVTSEGSRGIIDLESGESIIAPEFRDIQLAGEYLLVVSETGKKGLYDLKGNLVAPPVFDQIGKFRDSKAMVVINGKAGLLGAQGQKLIKPEYDFIEVVNDVAKAYKDQSMDMYTIKGTRVIEKTHYSNFRNINVNYSLDIDPLGESITSVSDSLLNAHGWRYNNARQRWGLVDKEDNVLLDYVYPEVWVTNDTFSVVRTIIAGEFDAIRNLRKYEASTWNTRMLWKYNFAIVDHLRGREVTDNWFWYLNPKDLQKGVSRFVLEGGRQGIIYPNGKIEMEKKVRRDGREYTYQISVLSEFDDQYSIVSFNARNIYNAVEIRDGNGRLVETTGLVREGNEIRFVGDTSYSRNYGVISREGELILEPLYSRIEDFKSNISVAKRDGSFGLISITGEELTEFVYDSIYTTEVGEGYGYVLLKGRMITGLLSRNGHLVIDPDYNEIGPLLNGLIRAQKEGKYGFIDSLGKEKIAFQFSKAQDFTSVLAPVARDYYWGYIDLQGNEVIPYQFKGASAFSEGKAAVRVNYDWRYIDEGGEFLFDKNFAVADPFRDGLARVKKKHWGILGATGEYLMKPRYTNLRIDYANKRIIAEKKDKWYLFDLELNKINEKSFAHIDDFHDGLARVKLRSGFAYINTSGVVVSPRFSRAMQFADSMALVSTNLDSADAYRSWMVINTKGQMLFKAPSNRLSRFGNDRGFYQKAGLWGMIDNEGEIVREVEFTTVTPFNEGKSLVSTEADGYFFVDVNGDRLFGSEIYHGGLNFANGRAVIQRNDFCSMIDEHGFEISSDKFTIIEPFGKDYYKAVYEHAYELADSEGLVFLSGDYNYTGSVTPNVMRVESGDKIGYFHLQKGWIWPLSK